MKHADIIGLQFGLVDNEIIRKKSVVTIHPSRSHIRKNTATLNSVYDPRMGTIFPDTLCSTCGQTTDKCAGHSAHIDLSIPVLSVLFVPFIHKLLTCICVRCARLLVASDPSETTAAAASSVSTDTPARLVSRWANRCERIRECPHCGQEQPLYWTRYAKVLVRPVWAATESRSVASDPKSPGDHQGKTSAVPTVTPEHIATLVDMMTEEDRRVLGFNSTTVQPSAAFTTRFIVPPILMRPPRSKRYEDDLTTRLRNLLKINDAVDFREQTVDLSLVECTADARSSASSTSSTATSRGKKARYREHLPPPENWKPKHLRAKLPVVPYHLESYFELQRHVLGFQDARYCVKNDHDYGRELGSVRNRFMSTRKKRGRIRANILGKRGDFTARTVASPDTFVDPDEVGVPLHVCMRVTVQERVCRFNYARLLSMVSNGPTVHPGANFIERGGQKYALPVVQTGLFVGDIVHRHLVRGDLVIMNRQPTLHRYSMMAYRVVPVTGNTFRVHLSVTKAHNLDFDGDEMNLFVVGDMLARAEAQELVAVDKNMFKNGNLLIGTVQHACLGAYLLTRDHPARTFPTQVVHQWLYSAGFLDLWTRQHVDDLLRPGRQWDGRSLLSVVLPSYDGRDAVDKKRLNHCLSLHLSSGAFDTTRRQVRFLGCLVRLLEATLVYIGSTIGTGDCASQVVAGHMEMVRRDVARVPDIHSEYKIMDVLSQIRNYIGSAVRTELDSARNAFVDIVHSGAKGNATHIMQNSGMVGQQLNNVSRRCDPLACVAEDDVYRRGFVSSSFFVGLSGVEFFYHLMAARVGLMATAVSTAETGYCYRRISKCIEDVRVSMDGSLRDANHTLLFPYAMFDGTRKLFSVPCPFVSCPLSALRAERPCAPEKAHLERLYDGIQRVVHRLNSMACLLPIPLNDMNYLVVAATAAVPGASGSGGGGGSSTSSDGDKARSAATAALSPRETFRRVRATWERVCATGIVPRDDVLLEATFFGQLRVHRLHAHGFQDPARLSRLLQLVASTFSRHSAVPNTPIGLIAAQEFSEPLTQMQLNRFHHSGERSDLVDGVQRIKEILNASKECATPSMTIVARAGYTFDPLGFTELTLRHAVEAFMDVPPMPPSESASRAVSVSSGPPRSTKRKDVARCDHRQVTRCTGDAVVTSDATCEVCPAACASSSRALRRVNSTDEMDTTGRDDAAVDVDGATVIRLESVKSRTSRTSRTSTKKGKARRSDGNVVRRKEQVRKPGKSPATPSVTRAGLVAGHHVRGETRPSQDATERASRPDPCPVQFQFRLHRARLVTHCVPPRVVADYMQQRVGWDVVSYTEDLEQESWYVVASVPGTSTSHLSAAYDVIWKTMSSAPAPIKGIPGIHDFHVAEKPVVSDVDGVVSNHIRTVITTRGSNLHAVIQLPWVDVEHTTTNNIHEIYTMFGIDAACLAIERNLLGVMNSNATSVRHTFLRVIARVMCQTGEMCAMTFSGMVHANTSSLKMATFERSLESFIKTAMLGHTDELRGISESVMVGKQVSVGTNGSFDIVPSRANLSVHVRRRVRNRCVQPSVAKILSATSRAFNANPVSTVQLSPDVVSKLCEEAAAAQCDSRPTSSKRKASEGRGACDATCRKRPRRATTHGDDASASSSVDQRHAVESRLSLESQMQEDAIRRTYVGSAGYFVPSERLSTRDRPPPLRSSPD